MVEYLLDRTYAHIAGLLNTLPMFAVLLLISVMALHRRWLASVRQGWSETRTNLVYIAINGIAVGIVNGLAVTILAPVLNFPTLVSGATLPIWMQGLLAVIVRDFALYWQHRFKHRTALWPFHAIHHSDTHLTWMTQFRRHPIDGAVAATTVVLALSILGFDGAAVAGAIAIVKFWGYFIHIQIRLPKLDFILITPDAHRLHHARNSTLHDCNFGILLSVWDHLFGTWRSPNRELIETGADPLTTEQGWIDHMLYPFIDYGQRICRWLGLVSLKSKN